MDNTTILGSALGQLGQTAKKAVQQVVKLPEEMAQDVGGQVGGAKQPAASAEGSGPLRQSSSEASEPKEEKKQQWTSDEERVKFLRDLYGPSAGSGLKQEKSRESAPSKDKKPTEFEEQIKDKSPEDQKKLMELRNQLHKENYYDPIFNPVKNPPAGAEERPAEKVENEKKEEMMELQKKEEKKPPPLAVVREQNKAEMFRGASG